MTVTVSIALLLFRVGVGLVLAAHGAQKLFGFGGGPGFFKASERFQQMGYQPGWLWLSLAIIGELGGGISLALGFLTPLGAAGILGAMFMAGKTHWKNGFWLQKGGYEYTLILIVASIAVGLIGPGIYSLDTLLRITLPEVWLFSTLAVAALLVDIIGILMTRNAVLPRSENVSRASSR